MVREDFIARRNAMLRKARRLVKAMPEAEARRLVVGGHDLIKPWMIANLDGCWGQMHEAMVTDMLGTKLGLLNR